MMLALSGMYASARSVSAKATSISVAWALRPRSTRRASRARHNGGDEMNATQQLHDLGQSLWLDNITRKLLTSGTLSRYIEKFAVTGLTSNPTIFDQAIKGGGSYDEAIRKKADEGKSGEVLFF